eukprot:NODE_293_length_10559_cov_1.046463.p3 type:complete len:399 gc:universal NODE_293_length_10559_cov_1.046463:4238-3042(-)
MPNFQPNFYYENIRKEFPIFIDNVDIRNNFIFDEMTQVFPITLRSLYASNNLIYGSVPKNTSIGSLWLSYNQINESIVNFSDSYWELRLDHNHLKSELPQTWPERLTNIDITGSVPNVNTSNYVYLVDLSWNNLSGNIPSLIAPYFEKIDVSHNQLSGEIDLGYSNLYHLIVSFNQFEKFPKSLPETLQTLMMDHNLITGQIKYRFPSTILTIDFSYNNLTGNIPYWEEPFHDWLHEDPRIILNISHNRFTGTIPQYLNSVNTLDLSHNYLSGCTNFQFTGRNYYLNNNYLSGNLSFSAPLILYLQNNSLFDVSMTYQDILQQCDLSENPMGPGVSGKTFHSLCNLNGTYVNGNETLAYNSSKCETRIFGFELVEIITTPFKTTTVPPTIIKRIFLFI